MVTTLFFLLIPVTLFLFLLMVICISNLFVFRSLKDYRQTVSQPKMSILIPARNEQGNIGPCVEALLRQDYSDFEVVVMDDDSTDSTWQVLERIAISDRRLKIRKGMPLPAGWLGKSWACHQLALIAEGDLLLFMDADTVAQHPAMLKRAAAAVQEEKADLISAFPRQIMLTFPEKLVMPFSYWGTMVFLPLAIAYHNQDPRFAAAAGCFMLFRKASFWKIGGFEAVRNDRVDDVGLCRLVRRNNMRWRLLDGTEEFSVRHYKNTRDLLASHVRNFYRVLDNMVGSIMIWLWLLIVFWLPIIVFITSVSTPDSMMPLLVISALGMTAALSTWLITYFRFRFPVYLTILYMVTILVMAILAVCSMTMNSAGKTTWKGRAVPGNGLP